MFAAESSVMLYVDDVQAERNFWTASDISDLPFRNFNFASPSGIHFAVRQAS